MEITHEFVSVVADGVNTSLVRPSDWNEDHVIMALAADPGSPVEGQIWVVASGTSPSRVIALKMYDDGATRTIASITY
jgi:hypothetical protein